MALGWGCVSKAEHLPNKSSNPSTAKKKWILKERHNFKRKRKTLWVTGTERKCNSHFRNQN
jgi:hypothetical protein